MRHYKLPVEIETHGWDPEEIDLAKLTARVLGTVDGQEWLRRQLLIYGVMEVAADPPEFKRGQQNAIKRMAHAYNLGKALEAANE